MQKIIPHLWFNTNAQEAAEFYTSIFNEGAIHTTTYYPEAGKEIHGMEAGTVLTVAFEIEGFHFIALNGGPVFTFTPAISFMVNFDPSTEEHAEERLGALWEKLSDGGKILMELDTYPFSKKYGWVQDKFGVSWQLILTNPDGEKRPGIIPTFLFVGDVSGKAEEALNLYTSVFKNAQKGVIVHYDGSQPSVEAGKLMFGDFMLEGVWFAAMDGGNEHSSAFNEAISLLVLCEDQAEIDYLWEKLSYIKESEQCGWIKDKFGVSWQITPKGMAQMLNSPDKEKANRAMEAMLQMKKIDIATLQKAFEG